MSPESVATRGPPLESEGLETFVAFAIAVALALGEAATPEEREGRFGRAIPASEAARAKVTTPRNMTRTALALTMTGRNLRGRSAAAKPKTSMRGTVPAEKMNIERAPAKALPVPRA